MRALEKINAKLDAGRLVTARDLRALEAQAVGVAAYPGELVEVWQVLRFLRPVVYAPAPWWVRFAVPAARATGFAFARLIGKLRARRG